MAADEIIPTEPATPIDPGLRSALALRTTLWRVVNAYPSLDEDDDVAAAWSWLEEVALQWREAAQLHRLEQLGDEFLPEAAVELLAAVESSLALTGSDDAGHWELTIGADELLERLLPVGPALWTDWDEILDVLWREREHRAGRPPTDRPDSWPAPVAGRQAAPAQ